jgi:NAD(P)-dependent dehydrogenase (short-subunit alcohol dehydrogenase family)
LLKVGAKKLVIGGRNPKLQEEFVETLKGDGYDTDEQVDGSHTIDLGDLQSVKQFGDYVATTYPVIDVLICNAGVMNTPVGVTKDGIEQQMGVNCVGHFLLAKLIANQTKRQVWVSSFGHTLKGGPRIDIEALRNFSVESEYDGFRAYQQSKLGNILLAKEFQKRYGPALEAVSLHPGAIYTSLYRETGIVAAVKLSFSMIPDVLRGNITQVFPKLPSAGAATTITCATLPSDQLVPGGYYCNCALGSENEAAKNEEDAAALFDYCDEATKKFQ